MHLFSLFLQVFYAFLLVLNIIFSIKQDKTMSKSVGKGAFILVVSGLICKLFSVLYRLPLTNILGIEGIAIYQMVMSLYSLATVFLSSGLTSALSKLISSARAKGEVLKIKGFLKIGIKYVFAVGLGLGFVMAIFSPFISKIQGFNSGQCYLIMVLLLPLGGLIGVYRGVIQGYENMTPTATSQIIEQVTKFAFGLIFAYLFGRQSPEAGVFGAFLGILISEMVAIIYLYFTLNKKVKFSRETVIEKREFFSAVLPLSFSGGVIPLTHAIESLVILPLLSIAGIENGVAKSLYGLQTGVVGTILSFPLLVSVAVGVALLPKISFLSSSGNHQDEEKTITRAFSVMWACLVPLVLGLTAISREVYLLLFPSVIKDFLVLSNQLTILTAFSVLLSGVMQFLLSILQAKGLFSKALIFSLIGGAGKIATLVILARIKGIGIFALPISNAVLFGTVSVCAMIKLYKTVKVPFFNLALPLLSGAVMFMAVKLFISSFSGGVGLFFAIIVGGSVYVVLTLPLWIEILSPLIAKFKKSKNHLENEG